MDNKLKKNIIYNALYQALVILLPILTMPYLVRTLSKEQIGINSYSLSVVQIFIVISFWGINNYASREIASQKDIMDYTDNIYYIFIRNIKLI